MLRKFSVSNFKGFNTEFVLDFQDVNGYAFNDECIKNGIVNNALIYGHNGVGKSNLGLAIFDITCHLVDINKSSDPFLPYFNAFNKSKSAKFHFEFIFEENIVIYEYEKTDPKTAIAERLEINGVVLAKIDRRLSNLAEIRLVGAETLNRELTNDKLSLLKYIKNNTQLADNKENRVFFSFLNFIEGMLFFRSLDGNQYLGFQNPTSSDIIDEEIIRRGNVKNLEAFLNKAGIECELKTQMDFDKEVIVFDFNGTTIPFYDIASTGTKSLTLFYYWLQTLREKSKVKFLFIDEFDAFYHHELSAFIVEELKKNGVQFILTSHNTSIITNDILRPDCYFLMNKNGIRSLSKSTSKELREAHNIEKMYKAGSFNV